MKIKKIIEQLDGFIENNNNSDINTLEPEIAKELKVNLEVIEGELINKKKTKDQNEKIEIEKKIITAVEKLEQKSILLFEKAQTIEGEDFFAEQFYYDLLIFLTKLRPRNNFDVESFESLKFLDPISQMPVKEQDRVYATTRYFYDINTLAKSLRMIKPIFNLKTGVYNARYLDPMTMKEFSANDKYEIQRVATRQNVQLPSLIATPDNPDHNNDSFLAERALQAGPIFSGFNALEGILNWLNRNSNLQQNNSPSNSNPFTLVSHWTGRTHINHGERGTHYGYDTFGQLIYTLHYIFQDTEQTSQRGYDAYGRLIYVLDSVASGNEFTDNHRINFNDNLYNVLSENNAGSLFRRLTIFRHQASLTQTSASGNVEVSPIFSGPHAYEDLFNWCGNVNSNSHNSTSNDYSKNYRKIHLRLSNLLYDRSYNASSNANNEFINDNTTTTHDDSYNNAEENDGTLLSRFMNNNHPRIFQRGFHSNISENVARNNNNINFSENWHDDPEESAEQIEDLPRSINLQRSYP